MAGVPSGALTTFLFSDIEGSTRLWDRDAEAMRVALARHDALMRAAIETQGGRVFKTVGDAFYAVFEQVEAAVVAALAAQRALEREPWVTAQPLRVRMALHTGPAEARDDDFFGPTLNRVARLLAAGHGGQVLLSAAAREALGDALPEGAALRDLGKRRLKDLVSPEGIFQLVADDLPADFPPLRSLEAFAHNLPVHLTSFVGREREMTALHELLGRTPPERLVTLTGVGGTGKTRLSLQVATQLLDRFPDGAWLVELAPLSDPALIPRAIITALGLREDGSRAALELLLNHLRARHLLLVLDNCEHLIGGVASVVESLLQHCPDLAILASSREALGIPGERSFHVPSLSLPEPVRTHPTTPGGPARPEADKNIVGPAHAGEPTIALTAGNAMLVAQICQRLDGIPLALELAAARTRMLSIEAIAARLDDRFRLLTGGSRTALPRQQTLRALIDWSYDLLPDVERRLLARLSVFAGGWTLEGAEQVCGGGEVAAEEVLDLLAQLTNKSLVVASSQRFGGQVEDRYRLLETIRQYGRDRLLQSGESSEVRDRHLVFFADLAERAAPLLWGHDQHRWLDILEAELDNIEVALEWSLASDAEGLQRGIRLAEALSAFWQVRGHWERGRRWAETLLAAAEGEPPTPKYAALLNLAGELAINQGAIEVARGLFERAHAVGEALGERALQAYATVGLGMCATDTGQLHDARALYDEAVSVFRTLNNLPGLAVALGHRGGVDLFRNPQNAREFYDENIKICRTLGHRLGVAGSLIAFGLIWSRSGDDAAARSAYEESLAIFQEMNDKPGIASAMISLGLLALNESDYPKAIAYMEEALSRHHELGDLPAEASAVNGLGEAARGQANDALAERYYRQALAINQQLGRVPHQAAIQHNLGYLAIHRGARDEALDFFGSALRNYQLLQVPEGLSFCLIGIAATLGTLGDQAEARLAARLFHAVTRIFHPRLDGVDQQEVEQAQAHTQARLGAAEWAAAVEASQTMTGDEALSLVTPFIMPAASSAPAPAQSPTAPTPQSS